jgi:hypothetical protein
MSDLEMHSERARLPPCRDRYWMTIPHRGSVGASPSHDRFDNLERAGPVRKVWRAFSSTTNESTMLQTECLAVTTDRRHTVVPIGGVSEDRRSEPFRNASSPDSC